MDKSLFLRRPDPANPWLPDVAAAVNAIDNGLWDNLERVPHLEPSKSRAALFCLLEWACQSARIANINIGRYGIGAIPHAWVIANIESVAEPILQTNDDWEWRRFLEICWFLDDALLQRVASRAIQSENEEIREAGNDFLNIDWQH